MTIGLHDIARISKNHKTNPDENSGQYWDHENVIFDAI